MDGGRTHARTLTRSLISLVSNPCCRGSPPPLFSLLLQHKVRKLSLEIARFEQRPNQHAPPKPKPPVRLLEQGSAVEAGEAGEAEAVATENGAAAEAS